MKKCLMLLSCFLLTGCFGSYNLENAVDNFDAVNNLTLEANVIYYESEFTDYQTLEYSYSEKIDWQNNRMKRYDFTNQGYLYYEMFSDGTGNIYEQNVDNEWYLSYEQIMVKQDFAVPEVIFIKNEVEDFERHFPMLNTYSTTADPRNFFSSDSVFYEASGQVEITVKVAGGILTSISYHLKVDDEKIFVNEIDIVDIDRTYVSFPFAAQGDKRPFSQVMETMGERILTAVNAYYAMSVVDEKPLDDETFVIKNNKLTEDSPEISVVGRLPEEGIVMVNSEGEVRMALFERGYCLQKDFDSSEFKLAERELENCNLP